MSWITTGVWDYPKYRFDIDKAAARGEAIAKELAEGSSKPSKFSKFSKLTLKDMEDLNFKIVEYKGEDYKLTIEKEFITLPGMPEPSKFNALDIHQETGRGIVKDGRFKIWCAPEEGIIVVEVAKHDQEADMAPDSRKEPYLADIMFMVWCHYCKKAGTSPGKLKRIIRWSIKAQSTIKMLESLGHTGDPEDKPEYLMYSKEGKMLLGTTNGLAPANMLLNHPDELGRKTITKVFVHAVMKDRLNSAPVLDFIIEAR